MTAASVAHEPQPAPQVSAAHEISVIEYSQIDTDSRNFRTDWQSDAAIAALEQLAASIAANGLEDPPKLKHHPTIPGMYISSSGNRRITAIGMNIAKKIPIRGYKLGQIPVMILPKGTDDRQERVSSLITNTQRRNLNEMEQARAFVEILTTGVPFPAGKDTAYATLTEEEIKLVISMATEFPADIETKLSVPSVYQYWMLPNLTVFKIVKQMMKTCTDISQIAAFVNRLTLVNLIDKVQHLVARGQMSIAFAVAMAPLESEYQYMAWERFMDSKTKMRLESFQAMCLELARDQIAGAQMTMIDMDFWKVVAVDEITDEGRRRIGKKRGLQVDPVVMQVLDDMDITRSLANQDTAIEIMVQGLMASGQVAAAMAINAMREKLHGGYWAKPADTAQAMAYMQNPPPKRKKGGGKKK